MASPCIDICRYDEATGWCLGCGMTRKDKKHWKKEKDRRPAIREALPGRLDALATAGLPTGAAAKKPKKKDLDRAAAAAVARG
ncbi:DUF1289 domain-containing protein [Paracraurococcus ruber]|uniref:DUF1289 domain-containing protein n=1 Tax=Paracraurococcus ruber TaxID=77675 RepID=A0ABS1D141_9PROT|nr:DUF1289 domain-containing protein [Paracraurococcus ruber]MBK1660524.1 hypothetical protein [Paracraurococcus ruber]TDG31210.1 DUF1289 domain-containing protein [Paracraurococcus ruber]